MSCPFEHDEAAPLVNHPHPGNIAILDKVGRNVVGLPHQTIIKFISRGFQFKCEKLKMLKKVECWDRATEGFRIYIDPILICT